MAASQASQRPYPAFLAEEFGSVGGILWVHMAGNTYEKRATQVYDASAPTPKYSPLVWEALTGVRKSQMCEVVWDRNGWCRQKKGSTTMAHLQDISWNEMYLNHLPAEIKMLTIWRNTLAAAAEARVAREREDAAWMAQEELRKSQEREAALARFKEQERKTRDALDTILSAAVGCKPLHKSLEFLLVGHDGRPNLTAGQAERILTLFNHDKEGWVMVEGDETREYLEIPRSLFEKHRAKYTDEMGYVKKGGRDILFYGFREFYESDDYPSDVSLLLWKKRVAAAQDYIASIEL